MTIVLTDAQRQALQQHPEGVEIRDDQTGKRYVLADADWHRRAQDALRKAEDLEAIRQGIADMEAGRGIPFEEFDERMRAKFGIPQDEA